MNKLSTFFIRLIILTSCDSENKSSVSHVKRTEIHGDTSINLCPKVIELI